MQKISTELEQKKKNPQPDDFFSSPKQICKICYLIQVTCLFQSHFLLLYLF